MICERYNKVEGISSATIISNFITRNSRNGSKPRDQISHKTPNMRKNKTLDEGDLINISLDIDELC